MEKPTRITRIASLPLPPPDQNKINSQMGTENAADYSGDVFHAAVTFPQPPQL